MGQQLTMTPQLQQAIRLLQLSTLDLQQEIQEALESNPMLERQEEGDDFDNSDPLADNIEQKPTQEIQEPSFQESAPTVDNLEEGDWNERIPNELPVDTAWEDIYQTSASSLPSNDDDEWDFTTRTSVGESLQTQVHPAGRTLCRCRPDLGRRHQADHPPPQDQGHRRIDHRPQRPRDPGYL